MAQTKRTTAKRGAKSAAGRRTTTSKTPARPARRPAAAAPAAPRRRLPLPTEPSPVEEIVIPNLSPGEMYRQEKQRRSQTTKTEANPIEEARREYLALLASEAEKGKGGRPKGSGKKKVETAESDD